MIRRFTDAADFKTVTAIYLETDTDSETEKVLEAIDALGCYFLMRRWEHGATIKVWSDAPWQLSCAELAIALSLALGMELADVEARV